MKLPMKRLSRGMTHGAVCGVLAVVVGPLVAGASGAFPGRNGLIAFNGHNGVLAMRPNGRDRHRLTAAGESPAFSPNGRKIVLAQDPTRGTFAIMNADGSGLREVRLSASFCRPGTPPSPKCMRRLSAGSPSFSPSGSEILFHAFSYRPGDHQFELYIVKVDGSGLRQITHRLNADSAAFAPDGTSIVFNDGSLKHIAAIRPDGTGLHRVPGTRGGSCPCSLSPDGKRLLFIAGGSRQAVYGVNINGTHRRRLSHPPRDRVDFSPAFSPNGKLIVFAREGFGHGDIFVMNANGTRPHALARADPGYSEPAWQPLP